MSSSLNKRFGCRLTGVRVVLTTADIAELLGLKDAQYVSSLLNDRLSSYPDDRIGRFNDLLSLLSERKRLEVSATEYVVVTTNN